MNQWGSFLPNCCKNESQMNHKMNCTLLKFSPQGGNPFPNIEWSPPTPISWPSVPQGVYLGQIKSDQFLRDSSALGGPCNSFSIWNLTKSDVCLPRSLSAATAEEDDYRATKRGAQRWWWWHLDFGASPLTPIWLLHSTSLSDIKPNEPVQSKLI